MLKLANASSTKWLGAALAAFVTAAAAPAFAQTTVQELTVTGRYGVGPEVRRLSAVVSYADLDLTTDAGRTALRERVRSTASDLCRRLGEGAAGGTALVPSCEQDAVNSVHQQERVAIAQAKPRAYAVNPPIAAPAAAAPTAESYGQTASVTTPTASATPQMTTNGPVPDTPENRRAFGGPMSRAGRHSAPAGN